MRELILAHDLGTSSNKACLFNIDGKLIDSANKMYATYFPESGYAEQDPEDWWEAVKFTTDEVIRNNNVKPEEIKGISFSAQSLGCIPVDKNGNCIREKTIIWMDNRATKEAEYIVEKYGARNHYETTGNSFDVSLYPCSKIMWMMKHEPEIYDKTYKFIGTKEYIIARLTGVVGYTDYSEAGMSGMFNLLNHDYEEKLLEITNIDKEKLCIPKKNTFVVGNVKSNIALELGLSTETKIVLGTLDNLACAIGAGCMKQGTYVTTLGTAGWIGVNSDAPIMSKDFNSNVMYVGDDIYHTSMHSHSACVAFDWVVKNMLNDKNSDYIELEKMASEIKAGSEGLFFMPSFLSGNTIFSSPYLGGAFLGLKLHHNQSHIVRAALEGVGYDLMMGMEFYEKMGILPEEVRVIGGGSKNELWRKILASMFNTKITVPNNTQHIGAMGAAVIAAVGLGYMKDFSTIDSIIKPSSPLYPDEEETKIYKKYLPVYKEFYSSLIPIYEKINKN